MGDDFLCKHLVVMRGALERIEGTARERLCMTVRGTIVEVIAICVKRIVLKSELGWHNPRCFAV